MSDPSLTADLHTVETFVRRFVVLSDDQAVAIALWVAHTHAIESAVATPYLSISSAEKRSGKTRLLEVLALLVAKPWLTGGTTKAALVRKVDLDRPTLLLDESDAAFRGDQEYTEAVRGVLNTGHRRGGSYTTCIGQGATIAPRDFSTFCAKAFAGIGRPPDTVEDRSIPIRLKRRSRAERVERFRERRVRPTGERLAEGLAMALEPYTVELGEAEPNLPDELDDRAQDVWEPLLAIADVGGSDWPARARRAAVRLSAHQDPDEDSLGVRLLTDCRDAFDGLGADRVTGEHLREYLYRLDEAPWGDWYGKPMSAKKIGELLRSFGIVRRSIWIAADERSRKGYLREQFDDPWERYLSPNPEKKRAGGQNGSGEPEMADPKRAGVEDASPEKPHQQAILSACPDRNGSTGDGRVSGDPVELATPEEEARIARLLALGVAPFDDEGSR